ncbi:MAG: Na+/H+ antiporter NhaC family protein [Gemmatimonadota bacterium]
MYTAAGLLALTLAVGPGPAPTPPATSAVPDDQAAAPSLSLEAPAVVLKGVPFGVRFKLESREDGSYRLVTATGRTLASGALPALEETSLSGLELAGAEELPLTLRVEVPGAEPVERRLDPRIYPGWISLLPPLLAIALALLFREVVVSLFLGVWLGALFLAGLNPLSATWRTMDRFAVPALADGDHAAIIIFTLLLAGMVGVMSRSGGTRGIVRAVRPLATTPRRAQLAAYLAGLAIFFDDYANTLIVGNTFRPITDRLRVSREKLAYIVDSTAAPIAAIIFVSTWVGFEISLIGDGLAAAASQAGTPAAVAADLRAANPFIVFLHSIPYLFYPILALLMVGLIVLTQRDFGPMWAAENRASRGEGLFREGAMLMADTSAAALEPPEDAPHRWFNAGVPVVTVVLTVILGLYFDGRASAGGGTLWEIFGAANPFHALLWGSLAGCLVAVVLAVGQRILKLQEAIEGWLGGMRAMLLGAVILLLAWSLSEVTQVLGTAPYLSQILGESLTPNLLPVLVFVTAAVVSFATGTSWGTMGILMPLVIPLIVAMGGGASFQGGEHYSLLLGTISSVLAGAIFGDHCSPISDTTVLSSLASGSDHVDHVRTQLPYALAVAIVGMLAGDIPTAYGMSPILSYLLGVTVLFLLLRFVGRPDHDSPQWQREGAGPGP